MTTYGYIKQQYPLTTNDQLKIVVDYKCQEIFIERREVGDTTELTRLYNQLVPGDLVIIASLQVFGKTAKEVEGTLEVLRRKRVQLISWSTQLHLNYYKRACGIL